MNKALRVTNIVIPAAAAAITAIAPLAVFGAEQAYKASHFDIQIIGEVSVTNPHVIVGHDYSTKIVPLDPTHEIDLIVVHTTRTLTEEEFAFDSATGDFWIAGDYIKNSSLFIYAHTVDRGDLEFTGEAQQTSGMNDFEYVFTYSGDYLPERSLIKVSIVQRSGDKIIHADGDKDDDYVLERDATGKYKLTVDLKFEEYESSTADFDLYCFYTSAVTGNQIEMSFSGFKATFIKP